MVHHGLSLNFASACQLTKILVKFTLDFDKIPMFPSFKMLQIPFIEVLPQQVRIV